MTEDGLLIMLFCPYQQSNCGNLFVDYYVCVSITASGTTTTTTTSATKTTMTTSTKTTTTAAAYPTEPGTIDTCTKFHLVVEGDSCYNLETEYSISDSDFRTWNPELDTNCDNMWLNYTVCIGV
jgi:hypothetical protein